MPVATNAIAMTPQRREVRFDRAAPYGSPKELMRHLGHRFVVPDYDLAKERFRIVIPHDYSTNSNWGLLVWISPGDDPKIPNAWEAELGRHKLLFVAPCNAGNDRHAIQRCRLALDAVCNMATRYTIDPQRIYIGGFSGGGRIASIMGVCYADLYAGSLSICGADFYQNVPAGNGEWFPATYNPDPRVLQRSKLNSKIILITGVDDVNRANTASIASYGFARQQFKNVLYLEVPGMGHVMPDVSVVRTALEFLAKPVHVKTPSVQGRRSGMTTP